MAFRESGKEAVLMIDAPTQAGAEYEAAPNGLLVESCWPVRPAPPPAPLPAQPLGYAGPVPPPPPPMAFAPPMVIEQTSKKYKWQMLAGFLLAAFSLSAAACSRHWRVRSARNWACSS